MNIPNIKIAVDGYSSTGKSSFAKNIAKEFNFIYLDSGAMYRAVTLFAQENGYIDSSNTISYELETALEGVEVSFGPDGCTYIGSRCIESEIRSMAVAAQVSPISTVPYVRNYVDCRLRAMSEGSRVVMDGRDIGTTVFPDAAIKIFMTASPQVRAQRRYDELVSKGLKANMEEVLTNLQERDYIDSHRLTSPLRRAEDAFILDNSNMTMEEELAWVRGLIQAKFNIYE